MARCVRIQRRLFIILREAQLCSEGALECWLWRLLWFPQHCPSTHLGGKSLGMKGDMSEKNLQEFFGIFYDGPKSNSCLSQVWTKLEDAVLILLLKRFPRCIISSEVPPSQHGIAVTQKPLVQPRLAKATGPLVQAAYLGTSGADKPQTGQSCNKVRQGSMLDARGSCARTVWDCTGK